MSFVMKSLDEELAAIEEASYCQKKIAPQSSVASSSCAETQAGDTTSSPHNNTQGRPSAVTEEKGGIESIQDVAAVSTMAKQRNSMSLNGSMLPNLAELQDLAGSDSDQDESPPTRAPLVQPVSGEADIQSMKDMSVVSRKARQRNSISLNGSMMPNLAELQGMADSKSDEKEPSPRSRKTMQRNSISLNGSMMPSNTLAELQDLAGSDNDDEEPPFIPAPHVPNLKASGGPQHRPLVGGFAAAAYEAARVDYYKKRGVSVRGHQPSKPRRSAPRYP